MSDGSADSITFGKNNIPGHDKTLLYYSLIHNCGMRGHFIWYIFIKIPGKFVTFIQKSEFYVTHHKLQVDSDTLKMALVSSFRRAGSCLPEYGVTSQKFASR
jgi:hypothetical protein